MKKPAVNHHKAHMSLCGLVAQAAAGGRHVWPRVPGETAADRSACLRVRAARPAFAAVRPAFFAACMVEAAVAEAGGGPAAATSADGPDGRPRGCCLPAGAAGECARPHRKRCSGGPRLASRGCRRRRQLNGQIEHFSQVGARLRGGAVRGAAITRRERTDAWDLVLTTLSSEPCVQSSIFGFVMT
jgi:hypothetical protein